MKTAAIRIITMGVLLVASLQQQAQTLDVTITNVGSNKIQITGTATAPGFSAAPANAWGSMNLTWRIPKSAANPSPVIAPPAVTPEVTAESTAFTGAAPRNAFNTASLDLTMFDLSAFGEPVDDGYWYFQVTGTVNTTQNLATGATVLLYEFTLPEVWSCPGCVELLTSDIPSFLNYGISTTSFVDNVGIGAPGTPVDVLNVVVNNAPLPVKFVSFDAQRSGNVVALDWKTTNEQQLKGYYVERSADGVANWTELGFVPAHLSPILNQYRFTDNQPLSNKNYYRIRGEDIDGKRGYTAVRLVKMDDIISTVSLYPVPAKSILKINVKANADRNVTIRVTDVTGRTVMVRAAQLKAGANLRELPVTTLSKGMYLIEMTGTDFKWTGRFTKE